MSLARLVNLRSMRRTAVAITLAVAYWTYSPSASAQFGGRGIEDAFVPDFLARDVSLFVESLGLEDWQRPVLEALVMDYQTSFDTGVTSVKDEMGKVKDQLGTGTPNQETIMALVLKPIERWTTQKKELRDRFLENVKTQLSDQQLERWPKFERAMRREKVLATGDLQGESVNILQVVRSVEFTPTVLAGLDAALEDYEVRLDEALTARSAKIESQKKRIMDSMTSGDTESKTQAEELIMAARVAVRDVQDQSRENLRKVVEGLTSEEQASAFETAVLEKAYPKVYRNDPILPLFVAAKATEGITPEQTTALEELEGRYKVEVVDMNGRLRDAFRAEEPKEPRRRAELMAARQQGGEIARSLRGESEPIQSARKSREEFYDRYRKAIMDILNEEQKKAMPNFGKGERFVPDEAERIREAKEAGGHSRTPGNNPLGSNAPTDRSGKSRKEKAQGEQREQIRNSPGDSRRHGSGAQQGGGRPGSNAAD